MIPAAQLAEAAQAPTVQPPNAPQSVSLTQGPGSNLTVTWAAPALDNEHSAATRFNVRFSPAGAGAWTLRASAVSPLVLGDLPAGAAVDVQVQSENAVGTSPWSGVCTLATAVATPNTPAPPSLAQGTGGELIVSWTVPAPDNAHGAAAMFNLRSSTTGTAGWMTQLNVTSPYALSGLAPGVAVDVQIQAVNDAGASGWSSTSTLATASGSAAPNAPSITTVLAPADGTATKLTVTWTAPAADSSHSSASGYNLRHRTQSGGSWSTVSDVTSPYTITGLAGGTVIDIEIQAVNAAGSPSAWSGIVTGVTWGATVAPGNWTAEDTQVHSASVAPFGGVQLTAAAAPTEVTGAAFAWSGSGTVLPTANLITAGPDGQTNGWGQYFNAPATPGTYYLWMLAQGSGDAVIGALVSPAITVT